MTDEEARAAMEARRGPKPESPFGFEIGPIAIPPTHHQRQRDYRSDLAAWERGDMAPLPTVGQFADTTGYSPERGALPNQYNSIERTEPSSVPHYGLNPQGFGTPQPPDQRMAITPGTGERHPYNPQFLNTTDFEHKPDPLAPQVNPLGPMAGRPQPMALQGNTAYTSNQYRPDPPAQPQGPLTPQAGAPQQIQRQEINREAPINNVQQNLMDASLYSQRYQGRYGRGGGASTLSAKQQMNMEALVKGGMPEDEAYILSRSMATGMENTNSLVTERGNKQDHRLYGERITGRRMDLQERLGQARIDHMKYMEQKERDLLASGKSPQDVAMMRLEEQHKFHQMVLRAWVDQHKQLPEEEKQDSMAAMESYLNDMDITSTMSPQKEIGGYKIPFTGGEPGFSPTPAERPPHSERGANPFNRLPKPQTQAAPDAEELRAASEEAAKDPGKFKGKKFVTKSGKSYTYDGKEFK